jgi:hypothetical protein
LNGTLGVRADENAQDCFAPCVAELLHQMHTEEKGHDTSQRLFPPERLVQRYSVEMLDCKS